MEVAPLGMLIQDPRVALPQVSQKSYNSFLRHSHPLVHPPLEAESLLFLVQFQQTMKLKMVLPLVILEKLNCFQWQAMTTVRVAQQEMATRQVAASSVPSTFVVAIVAAAAAALVVGIEPVAAVEQPA